MRIGCITILVIAAILYSVVRVGENESAKSNPPAACILFGGQWDLWNGWRCE